MLLFSNIIMKSSILIIRCSWRIAAELGAIRRSCASCPSCVYWPVSETCNTTGTCDKWSFGILESSRANVSSARTNSSNSSRSALLYSCIIHTVIEICVYHITRTVLVDLFIHLSKFNFISFHYVKRRVSLWRVELVGNECLPQARNRQCSLDFTALNSNWRQQRGIKVFSLF